MNKLKKKIGFAVLFAGLLVLAPSFAKAATYGGSCDSCNTCNDCYDACECWGDFVFGADFLYWKPCVAHTEYVNTSRKTDDCDDFEMKFSFKDVCPDWEPGLRVYFAMPDFYCDWGLAASWTWIESDDSSSTSCDRINPTLIPDRLEECFCNLNKASGKWDSTYNEWDILFSTDLSCKECHHFMPFFGVAGIIFDQDFKAKYEGTRQASEESECDCVLKDDWNYKWSSDLWGVGLKAGTEYQYRFSDCFSFFTKASGTILYSEDDSDVTITHEFQKENGSPCVPETHTKKWKFSDDHCCTCIPGYHIGVGLNYESSYCDWDIAFRFGYEFLQWFNMPSHRILGDDSMQSHQNDAHFGYSGFFAGLALGF